MAFVELTMDIFDELVPKIAEIDKNLGFWVPGSVPSG